MTDPLEIRSPSLPKVGETPPLSGNWKGEGPGRGFQDLLETIQRLRLGGEVLPAAEDPVRSLEEALGNAGEAHRKIMDLSRELESAFRRALGDS